MSAGERLIVRGARIVDPAQQLDAQGDLVIEAGHVVSAGAQTRESDREGAYVLDAAGLVLTPGFVDLHAHFPEPGDSSSETIDSGTRAAARGGFTTVHMVGNTEPPLDDPSLVRFVIARARQSCGVRVRPIGAATRDREGAELTDFASLLEAGVAALSDAPRPVRNAATLRRALERVHDLGAVLIQQPIDQDLAGSGVMHEGAVSMRLGLHGIPRMAEATFAARDAAIALATGGRLHISHVSNAETVDVVRHFKRRGAPITAGVSPHHLTLTDEAVIAGAGYDTNAKLWPPLCEEADRRALVEALEDGTIDAISTGHRPRSPSSKDALFDAATYGVIGLESAFALLYTKFVEPGQWPLGKLIGWLTSGPAKTLPDVRRPVGSLAPGSAGDFVLHEFGGSHAFDAGSLESSARNSPWLGSTFAARTVFTAVGGRPVFLDRAWAAANDAPEWLIPAPAAATLSS